MGLTAGPHQHFSIALTRAVEEGVPLVRVANTGISAVVDPFGRTVAFLELGARGVIDAPLPVALTDRPIYSQLGDTMFLVFLAVLVLLGFICIDSRKNFVATKV